jgi:hypothetical protein
VQSVPEGITQAAANGDWPQLRDPLTRFSRYATYATHGALAQILDRLALGLATHRIPDVPMCPMPLTENEAAMGCNFIRQLHCLRDACALMHDDPRARSPGPLPCYAYCMAFDVGGFQMLPLFEFYHLADHMIRRARDRAWERVREPFATRLAS